MLGDPRAVKINSGALVLPWWLLFRLFNVLRFCFFTCDVSADSKNETKKCDGGIFEGI